MTLYFLLEKLLWILLLSKDGFGEKRDTQQKESFVFVKCNLSINSNWIGMLFIVWFFKSMIKFSYLITLGDHNQNFYDNLTLNVINSLNWRPLKKKENHHTH
jgi:hypothetical protein